MSKNLVIVESPAKAKTIEKYLGSDFVVKSSVGHIRDLPKSDIGVDVEAGFEPNYVISPDKKTTVSDLKKLVGKSEKVWLATDEDREGEAIAWHLAEALGLDVRETERIVFSEITKNAILKAIDKPRRIDLNLVNAQQARRVLDRLVGFKISPILWRKIQPGLSAGRVQSVAVRLIVEREKEINKFVSTSSFRVLGYFETESGNSFKAELPHRPAALNEANNLLEELIGAQFMVERIEKKPGFRKPAAPFTTSTLQQEAARKLRFSVSQTMSLAQRLYENGHITYMRTDSTNLSNEAQSAALRQIEQDFGPEYTQPRNFKSKAKGAQEAHEAIRPTNLSVEIAGDNDQQRKLYDLIRKRALASQMADAKLERTTVDLSNNQSGHKFVAKGEVIAFDGFLKLYMESSDDEPEENDGLLPAMRENEPIIAKEIEAVERFSKHPPRFTEASLVKKLEELGIGRPSTYAPTISTIIQRKYVEKTDREGEERKYALLKLKNGTISTHTQTEITGAEKSKLFPTDVGTVVNTYLVDQFGDILDYQFTAKVEEEFDEIAAGDRKWNEMIGSFYDGFNEKVEAAVQDKGRARGDRLLGSDPKSGRPVYAKIGRYGSMIQIGDAEDEEKPKFAGLIGDQKLETITLEEALKLFELPRSIGLYEGEEMVAGVGRFGPYVRYGKLFVSIKGHDPLTISAPEATELVKEKIEAEKNKFIAVFDSEEPAIEVLNGRYGPYLRQGKTNYRIPKDANAANLTLEDCKEIITQGPAKKGGARRKSARKS